MKPRERTAFATVTFTGAAGNELVADVFGSQGNPVLLLHGAGQTRHAWTKAATAIAQDGHIAYSLDQRGHGDSDWVANGNYEFSDFAADVRMSGGSTFETEFVA